MTVAIALAAGVEAPASPAVPKPAPESTPQPQPQPQPTTVELPSLRGTITHAATYLLLGNIVPLATFYVLFTSVSLNAALLGVLGWSALLIGHRVRGARRIEASLILSTVLTLVRIGITWGTGSAFVYLLQPLLSTFVTSAALLGSVVVGRPFTERIALDYVPLPADLRRQPSINRMFARISLIWGFAYSITGAVGLWLLATMSLGEFMIMSKTVGLAMTGSAIALSILLFLRTLRRHRMRLRFGATPA